MSDVNNLFQQTLKNNGYSITEARQTVFLFLNDKEPQTMKQIVTGLPKINKASIYRVIALFEKLGIVQRLQIGWKYKIELSDLFNYHHHHLSCRECGNIVALRDNASLEASLRSLATEYGFSNLSHQLEVSGVCPTCQQKT